jgi:D-amino-acid oxidase
MLRPKNGGRRPSLRAPRAPARQSGHPADQFRARDSNHCRLVHEFVLFGGKIVIRRFDTPRDLMSLPESIIVNCTGLGSKTLFNDQELTPIKGQLTFCAPQPEVNYRVFGHNPNSTVNVSINPRSDGIAVGNMMERGNGSLEPNEEVRKQNVEAAMTFFAAMRAPART